MSTTHTYTSHVKWTGNTGQGTKTYKGYQRSWDMAVPDKPVIHCSNDPLLGGDPTLYNPEDLLLSSLSACHMLWYLHLASEASVTVHEYLDYPVAEGETLLSGAGRFLSATLKPHILIGAGSDIELAYNIHNRIHEFCFIARSLSFDVKCEPSIKFA